MVRIRRAKRVKRTQTQEQHDEDDSRAYKNMPVPDKKSSQYTKDQIDMFHDEKIAKLLAHGVHEESDLEEIDDEEEVMALDESESEDEEDVEEDDEENEEEGTDMESDLDGKEEEELPNEMAWGTKKKLYYNSDYVTTKGKSQEELMAEEQEEEEEAINIQKRLAANLSEEDYDLNFLQDLGVEEKKTDEKEAKIVKDLKQMSQKEKMKLLKKESPELLELIQDFKTKLTELKDELHPLVQMVNDGRIPPGKGADYLKTKQQLYLNYCTNISFYMALKAKRIPAHNHPVIERLLTYRNLINELGEVDARLAPELRSLLADSEKGKATSKTAAAKKTRVSTKKPKDSGTTMLGTEEDSDSEGEDLRYYRAMEEQLKLKRKGNNPEAERLTKSEEQDPDAKRGITYQMAKNKGLTPKRKKIDRNPRVKNKEKYRRAQIRRKGQVREVRREESKYSGELSGIRAGVKKSIKLK
ncbi:something about silencing protein 10 [Betta splendens]|uniref:Something about silencing protein 10 n=1 Tax=Betta splendens TaxID=158456 RepID=A0A6P7MLY7_BETSP|nr:something about silencing protein 10 [Betta splendens]